MTRWKPIVNPGQARVLEVMCWVEDRDFYVSPYVPDDYVVAYNEEEYGSLRPEEKSDE